MPPRGVLLDVDGTLLDSNDAHAKAWLVTFGEFGLPAVSFESVRKRIGEGGDKLLAETVGVDESSVRGKKMSERRRAVFMTQYLPALKPFPGARALLERLRGEGLKRVVATSAQGAELDALLDAAGVRDLIEDQATSSDADASKPDPDIIEAAIARSGLSAEELVMIGDTPYDVEAARRAGVATVALRSGGWRDADLDGAVAIYDSVAQLLEEYENSPLDNPPGRCSPARTSSRGSSGSSAPGKA